MKVPNVVVVSRIGDLRGICWYEPRKVSVKRVDWHGGRLVDETYHVISDVRAQGSRLVVHKCCRVGGESRQADVQHVVVLRWQRKGRSRERRFLMLPDVVKLALRKAKRKKKNPDVSHDQTFQLFWLLVLKFSFTFNFKLMLEVETSGDDTMEYSISAYLSTLAKTAVE